MSEKWEIVKRRNGHGGISIGINGDDDMRVATVYYQRITTSETPEDTFSTPINRITVQRAHLICAVHPLLEAAEKCLNYITLPNFALTDWGGASIVDVDSAAREIQRKLKAAIAQARKEDV